MRVQLVAAPLMACDCACFVCYIVFMANTSEHISVRLPAELVGELREEARREGRSLAWVIAARLQGGRVAHVSMTELPLRVERVKPAKVEAVTAKPEIDLQAMAEEIQATAYRRPAHSPTCPCAMCGSKK